MYGLCSWLVFGFVAGLVARAIMPGTQRMGIIMTSILGIAGSFVGGVLSAVLAHRPINNWSFTPSGFIGAVIGALVLLLIGGMMGGGRRY